MPTESENLAREAREAKAAIRRTVKQLQHELAHTADPRGWVKAHPWATLGVAAIAGFAAAEAIVPSAEENAIKHLAAMEAAIRGETEDQGRSNGDGAASAAEPAGKIHHKLLSTLAMATLEAIKPLLTTLLTGVVSRAEPPPEHQNGPEGGVNNPSAPPAEWS